MAPIGDVIAANVRAERARRRWTQAELGERVGWPRSSVSDVESGRRKLTADDLVALCAAFEVTLIKLADSKVTIVLEIRPRRSAVDLAADRMRAAGRRSQRNAGVRPIRRRG